MEKEFYSKSDVIEYVWQYSRYHGNLLSYCEQIAKEDSSNARNGFAALIFLLNLTENIFKDRIKNYDANLINVINELKNQGLITQTEYTFLNDRNNSIRRLRNLLAHANLSKYNLVFIEEGREILYPLTENETCIKLYEMFSGILFNLMLRIISVNFIKPFEINLDDKIKNLEINIKELTPEELLELKGVDVSGVPTWKELSEIDRYRLAENTSDVNMYLEIFKRLF
ncbi:hypothetical protein COA19_03270 [Bacillus thuringiensis]|uniref:hypothetical protein n=1 Tax=Bacillus thuringiensis TaxID=1428 RepID=UPI000BFDA074|nr:hypothetical protein [Bacillus thuringiensis]PGQ42456.1 hypothetical protein COA19_03270 [Bacillus thuringiensis]PGW84185.1 hypothetical protein COE21_00945 [Bacillus thuringiensis]